jgi:hypothetical protein
MVVLIANHPPIIITELKISLPEAIVVLALKTLSSPGLSWLTYRMVQARVFDYLVCLIVVYAKALVA